MERNSSAGKNYYGGQETGVPRAHPKTSSSTTCLSGVDAPKLAEAACCYEDCCVRYDVSAKAMAVQVLRASLEHCYLRIPHCIKGTVPAAIVA